MSDLVVTSLAALVTALFGALAGWYRSRGQNRTDLIAAEVARQTAYADEQQQYRRELHDEIQHLRGQVAATSGQLLDLVKQQARSDVEMKSLTNKIAELERDNDGLRSEVARLQQVIKVYRTFLISHGFDPLSLPDADAAADAEIRDSQPTTPSPNPD